MPKIRQPDERAILRTETLLKTLKLDLTSNPAPEEDEEREILNGRELEESKLAFGKQIERLFATLPRQITLESKNFLFSDHLLPYLPRLQEEVEARVVDVREQEATLRQLNQPVGKPTENNNLEEQAKLQHAESTIAALEKELDSQRQKTIDREVEQLNLQGILEQKEKQIAQLQSQLAEKEQELEQCLARESEHILPKFKPKIDAPYAVKEALPSCFQGDDTGTKGKVDSQPVEVQLVDQIPGEEDFGEHTLRSALAKQIEIVSEFYLEAPVVDQPMQKYTPTIGGEEEPAMDLHAHLAEVSTSSPAEKDPVLDLKEKIRKLELAYNDLKDNLAINKISDVYHAVKRHKTYALQARPDLKFAQLKPSNKGEVFAIANDMVCIMEQELIDKQKELNTLISGADPK
jgi:hypothetical protein